MSGVITADKVVAPSSSIEVPYFPGKVSVHNFKCHLFAEFSGVSLKYSKNELCFPSLPAIEVSKNSETFLPVIFGCKAVCQYLLLLGPLPKSSIISDMSASLESVLFTEEAFIIPRLSILQRAQEAGRKFPLDDASFNGTSVITGDEHSTALGLMNMITSTNKSSTINELKPDELKAYLDIQSWLSKIPPCLLTTSELNGLYLAPVISTCLQYFPEASFSPLLAVVNNITNSKFYQEVVAKFDKLVAVPLPTAAAAAAAEEALLIDWTRLGLLSTLKRLFTKAIQKSFPMASSLYLSEPSPSPAATSTVDPSTAPLSSSSPTTNATTLDQAVLLRCRNAAFGDFQCNNAIAIAQALKKNKDYSGPTAPKDVANAILASLTANPLIASVSAAPNGFINIHLSTETLISAITSIVKDGPKPPVAPKLKVLVDFSSPNIAKEMHVGHLRSTILGDAICRILEFCGHDVLRVNHVGDWGTQFGMLIAYLQEEYPTILSEPPNITDLNIIYKAAKKRFDEVESFKETSRQNVVKLQGGDAACRAIWNLLCNISRAEFQKVYDRLEVTLQEVGESFYNSMIPGTIKELENSGHLLKEEGMLIAKIDGFTIPLILRKSDGGYGYDSTDMTALNYRLGELKRDWIIYVTDAGQANHFYMCFDLAKKAGWVTTQKLSHIGFGVICGEDNKRFKSRSGDTVRLVDLLDAAKEKMEAQLRERELEGKTPLKGDAVTRASSAIGYGAVKYFDLKQNPATNYIFSYDRMLDTRGDTAVYLLFSFARIASILRKAKEERGIDVQSLVANKLEGQLFSLTISHPSERALGFELLQFGDVLQSTLHELGPNRLCEYLKDLSVKATEFVTKCQVLNSSPEEQSSRLQLCEAVRVVMEKCFQLLGITPLERI